jgi:hypothetical protein
MNSLSNIIQALVYEITYNDAPRFVISEELAAYLRKPQTD